MNRQNRFIQRLTVYLAWSIFTWNNKWKIPQIQVTTRLQDAARHGVKPGDIRRAVAVVTAGLEVSDVLKDGKIYGVWLWSDPEARRSIDNIRNLTINTPFGGRVALSELADIALVPTPNKIKREDNSRRIDIHGNVRGRSLSAVGEDVEQRLESLSFPRGYHPSAFG